MMANLRMYSGCLLNKSVFCFFNENDMSEKLAEYWFQFVIIFNFLFSHWENSLYLKMKFKERFRKFYANLHATLSVVYTNNAVGISICSGSPTDNISKIIMFHYKNLCSSENVK